MLKIPCFVSRKILVTGLNDSLSVLMSQIKPSILPASDPESTSTLFGNIFDNGNNFNTVSKFDTNLVS